MTIQVQKTVTGSATFIDHHSYRLWCNSFPTTMRLSLNVSLIVYMYSNRTASSMKVFKR